MGDLVLAVVAVCGFLLLVLMARVAVHLAFRGQPEDLDDGYRATCARNVAYYEGLAKEYDARALRWALVHDPDQARECRETARRYRARAQQMREHA